MDTNEIYQALVKGPVTVNFTKVNGLKRTMVATLNAGYLPKKDAAELKARDPNLLVVWDIEQQGWRTIKVESIIQWAPGEHTIEKITETGFASTKADPKLGWTPNK